MNSSIYPYLFLLISQKYDKKIELSQASASKSIFYNETILCVKIKSS